MTIDVDAVYEDGVLKPDLPLDLKERARVRVTIETKDVGPPDDDPRSWGS